MTHIEILEHTADIGLRVTASTPEAAFIAAAEGMFDIMVNREGIGSSETLAVNAEADAYDILLVAWLEELLYHYEIEGFVPRMFATRELTPQRIQSELTGDRLDAAIHETGVQIKAVTYHQLRAEATDQGFHIQVIFDI
jgi:SHS2 domain-containing protein